MKRRGCWFVIESSITSNMQSINTSNHHGDVPTEFIWSLRHGRIAKAQPKHCDPSVPHSSEHANKYTHETSYMGIMRPMRL